MMTTRRSFIRYTLGAAMAVFVGAYCPGLSEACSLPDGPFGFTRTEPSINNSRLIVGSINDRPWRGDRAGTVMCTGAWFERRNYTGPCYYQYTFERRSAGWDIDKGGRRAFPYKSMPFDLFITPTPTPEQSPP